MTHDHVALQPYGWSIERSAQLRPGLEPARVLRHDGRTLLAITARGTRQLRIPPRLEPVPTVGDWVAVPSTGEPDDELAIFEVLPRRSLLRRQSADEVGEQALAANVDLVLVTCGVDRPLRAGRVQRLAAQAWDAGATPVLVLTKAVDPEAVDLPRLELEHPGMQVVATAALEGVGLAQLRAVVAGRTAVLVGESGAGKSTLTNALLGREVAAVGRVRAGDAKGRHTTTSRQLHRLPGEGGGVLIDTPGIRSVGLAAEEDSVDAVFPDVTQLALDCRFADCRHAAEPGCAVRAALDEGRLAPARYEGWARLQREVANAALRATPHEWRAQNRRFGRMTREVQARKRG